MNLKEQLIIEYVKQCQEDYPKGHELYKEYLEKMEKTDLSRLGVIDVEIVIKPFLYKWGRMGRVLGREKFAGWENNLVEQVQLNLGRLEIAKEVKFESSNLNEHKANILNCYESFKKIVDNVAAPKVLHIICPNFFPLWDNPISEIVRNERNRIAAISIEDLSKIIENFSGEDYFYFMNILQTFLKKYEDTFIDLAKFYEKGVLKIIDDFLWMLSHRSLSIYF